MRIRMLKNVLVEVEKRRLQEVWDKQLKRWEEISVESIDYTGKTANICTEEGDIIISVPIDAFEKIS